MSDEISLFPPEEPTYYACPVCYYALLTDPPANHEICPQCGTEFGLDDYEISHEQLRAEWVKQGMPWFSNFHKKGEGD